MEILIRKESLASCGNNSPGADKDSAMIVEDVGSAIPDEDNNPTGNLTFYNLICKPEISLKLKFVHVGRRLCESGYDTCSKLEPIHTNLHTGLC